MLWCVATVQFHRGRVLRLRYVKGPAIKPKRINRVEAHIGRVARDFHFDGLLREAEKAAGEALLANPKMRFRATIVDKDGVLLEVRNYTVSRSHDGQSIESDRISEY